MSFIDSNKIFLGAVFTALAMYMRIQISKIIKGQRMLICSILFSVQISNSIIQKNRFSSKLCASLRYFLLWEYLSASPVGVYWVSLGQHNLSILPLNCTLLAQLRSWRRERLPTPVFWPGEFHGLSSPLGHNESDTTEQLTTHLR